MVEVSTVDELVVVGVLEVSVVSDAIEDVEVAVDVSDCKAAVVDVVIVVGVSVVALVVVNFIVMPRHDRGIMVTLFEFALAVAAYNPFGENAIPWGLIPGILYVVPPVIVAPNALKMVIVLE
jgi:hypothetical protein